MKIIEVIFKVSIITVIIIMAMYIEHQSKQIDTINLAFRSQNLKFQNVEIKILEQEKESRKRDIENQKSMNDHLDYHLSLIYNK